MWMCAAIAGPVRPAYVSFHFSLLPTTVAVKAPWADAFLTTCFGTSWRAESVAVQVVAVRAVEPADANAVTASAQTAPAARNATSLLITRSSIRRGGVRVIRSKARFGLPRRAAS